MHVGTPETVRALLSGLAEATQADEIMVVCAVPDQEARRRSYSLLAQAWGLAETAAAA